MRDKVARRKEQVTSHLIRFVNKSSIKRILSYFHIYIYIRVYFIIENIVDYFRIFKKIG